MNESANTSQPTSDRNVLIGILVGAAAAAIILFAFVLPAEYGVDPTGIGSRLGLTKMTEPEEPTRTIQVQLEDVLGGNDKLAEVEIPAFREPVPLPNPDVHQTEAAAPQFITMEVTIPAEGETEVKTVLQISKVITYSWQTDRGTVYSDYHGHDIAFGPDFFVRYQEDQDGSSGHSGSLVAPFSGEHGWYWLNYNDFPVTITLTVTGYYDDIIDYSDTF